MREPKVHELKTDQHQFADIAMERKLAEIRFDDRGFRQGDYLFLRETTYSGRQMRESSHPLIYTGCTAMAIVSHIHTAQGMMDNWAVMSIKVLSKATGGKYGM
jgi:hypothetical protein